MARKYDIAERLKSKNEKPCIIFGEDVSFAVDTSMVKGFTIMAIAKKMDDTDDPADFLYQIIEIALGKKAVDYIKSIDITTDALNLIMTTILAAYTGNELQDEDEVTEPKK